MSSDQTELDSSIKRLDLFFSPYQQIISFQVDPQQNQFLSPDNMFKIKIGPPQSCTRPSLLLLPISPCPILPYSLPKLPLLQLSVLASCPPSISFRRSVIDLVIMTSINRQMLLQVFENEGKRRTKRNMETVLRLCTATEATTYPQRTRKTSQVLFEIPSSLSLLFEIGTLRMQWSKKFKAILECFNDEIDHFYLL